MKMMKRFIKILIFILLLSLTNGIASAQADEYITDFYSFMIINDDGTVTVEEQIIYNFPDQRHGIFRNIPLTKKNQDGDSFKMNATNISVYDKSGKSYKFQDESTSTKLSLKIGDPNKTITGRHVYLISYTLSGALTYFSDHDELYWNVTGNDWEIPIQYSSAIVQFSNDLEDTSTSNCFTGTQGKTESKCSTEEILNSVQIISNRKLQPYEGLTFTVGFPKGIVAVLEPVPDTESLLEKVLGILIVVITILYQTVLPIVIIIKALNRRKKTSEEKRVVAAWFDPPKTPKGRDLTAGEVGVLFDKKGDVRDITATLIQLAQKGYLKIIGEESKSFWEKANFSLVQLKSFEDDNLLEYERYLLKTIFVNDKIDQVETLKGLGKRIGFATKLKNTYEEISNQLLSDKMFAEDPYKIKATWLTVLFVGLFIFNPLLILAAYLMSTSAKKTKAGDSAWAVIESMRNFVKSQDKQLEFQAKNQMFFEKLLPFAIALGVEKIWLERFKDLKLAQPEWLEGSNMNAFSYGYLMSNFNNSVSSAVSMSSTRSSSGHSSGFSGGFSGGGGGGGGGGSW